MMMRGQVTLGLMATVLMVAAGCRYTTEGGLPAHIRSVEVPVFRNRTTDRELESGLTRAVQETIAASSRLRLAGPEADAVLRGTIIRVHRTVTDEDGTDAAVEGQIIITARVQLVDRTGKGGRVLLDRTFTSRDLYRETGVYRTGLGASETTERPNAVRDLGRVIGRAVLDYWPAEPGEKDEGR